MPTPTDAVAAAPARTGRHANPTVVVLFLSLAGLSFAVMQSLVAPALPVIAKDLETDTNGISWVITAYLLSASVLTPILGRLGDMLGKRKVLLVVVVLLGLGTAGSALAPSLGVLIVARALQGAAGAIVPLSIAIVRDELPAERVGVTVGLLSAIFGIGAGLGIVLAGPVVDHLSWQWLFWLPLVLIVIALAGIMFGVPESPVRTPGKLDILGTGILSTALLTGLLAISKGRQWGWTSTTTLTLAAAGILGLVAFVLVELRVAEPLIDMRVFAIRGVWTTNLVGMAVGFAMFGTFMLIPTLLELPSATGYGFGKPVTQAGLFLLPTTIMMLVFGPISGLLDRRFGPKVPLVIGGALIAAAFTIPAVDHDSIWDILTSGVITGAGMGLVFAAMSNAIIEAVPASHTGEATSVNTIVRTIGGSIGTAVIAAVIAADSTPQGLPLDSAFTHGFWVCTAIGVLGIVAALALPSAAKRRTAALTNGVDDLPSQSKTPVTAH